jgi:hypothetical protein
VEDHLRHLFGVVPERDVTAAGERDRLRVRWEFVLPADLGRDELLVIAPGDCDRRFDGRAVSESWRRVWATCFVKAGVLL